MLVLLAATMTTANPTPNVASVTACLKASRRLFSADAQMRKRYRKPLTPNEKTYAFDVLEPVGACKVRVSINDDYAVPKGIQGAADTLAEFDLCEVRALLQHLKSSKAFFWDGSAPGAEAAQRAVERHDLRHLIRRPDKSLGALFSSFRNASTSPDTRQLFGERSLKKTKRYATCAVVGGAPSLAKATNGALIDGHDAVFRFNDHPVGGPFGTMVGNRSTFRVANAIRTRDALPKATPGVPVRIVHVVSSNHALHVAMQAVLRDGAHRRHILSPTVYHTFYEHFRTGGLSGALGVWLAMGMCDRVTLFGFSSPCELGSKYSHYHSDTKYRERVQVNTVKVVLWMHMLRCAHLVRWAPPDDRDGPHACSTPLL